MAKDSHKVLLDQLKNPFEPRLVKWTNKGGKSPTYLAYIDARDVMKRLDDVMGAGNYQTRYISVDGGFICELSLRIDGEWLTRSDGASVTKIEAIKGGISDSLKRAANAWGIGRYLYYLPKWCNKDNDDQWPNWALPNNKIENWEDIAEMETDTDTGMDEEGIAEIVVSGIDLVRGTKTIEELKKVVDSLDGDSQRILTDVIANKTDELLRGNTDDTQA